MHSPHQKKKKKTSKPLQTPENTKEIIKEKKRKQKQISDMKAENSKHKLNSYGKTTAPSPHPPPKKNCVTYSTCHYEIRYEEKKYTTQGCPQTVLLRSESQQRNTHSKKKLHHKGMSFHPVI